MKLETLLDKRAISVINALGCDARAAIEKAIVRYNLESAENVAWGLAEIAGYTKDKDAVAESARVIGRYDGDAASSVALELARIAGHTKDKDTVAESARVIGRYDGYAALGVARGLVEIAEYTKDKDAVINATKIMSLDEIINTVKRYGGDAAKSIARGLMEITGDTKDEDSVIESVRTIGRYDGDAARGVAWELALIAEDTKDKDAVMESVKAVGRYDGDTARKVASGLARIAECIRHAKDKGLVINAAEIMSLDEIINTVKRYDDNTSREAVSDLGWLAIYTKDKDTVAEAARIIGKYDGYAAGEVTSGLRWIAEDTKDKDAVIESMKVIGKYDGDGASSVARGLAEIAEHTKDKDAVINATKIMSLDEIINTVKRYDGDAAESIAWGLARIAGDTKDKDAVAESARVIGKYDGYAAMGVARGLAEIAEHTKDKDAVGAACGIVQKAGSYALDLLQPGDFAAIRRDGLDALVEGKESFDAVAAYARSGGELPLPTRENIKTYRDLAFGCISDAYGIRKRLDIGQVLMLFSVEKGQRKGLAELVNKSAEIGRKEYSISAERSRPMDIDPGRLPYLMLTAVTGSRDRQKEKEAFDLASKIVGEKTVRKARDSFNSSYKSRISEIASHVNKGEVDKAIAVLKDTKDESINDVLACADYRENGFSGGKAVLSAVESNNPLDYDNRVQIACVYLPRNYEEGIYEYCKDGRFTLVRYDIGGKTLGSAICYVEKDTFLVDSVEGHRTFRKPQIFEAVYADLVARAGEKGAKRIVFSEGGTNDTPKRFIEYLGKLGLRKGRAKMALDTDGHLEADEKGVKGYVVEI